MDLVGHMLHVAIRSGTPLLLAALGEIFAERSGVMNLGIEGMMLIGAITGFAVALGTGQPWLGLLAACVAGLLMSLVHAFISISLYANQVVSGLALSMLGLGLSSLVGHAYVGVALPSRILPSPIPGLADLPVVGPALFYQDPIVYLALGLAVASWFVLYKTKWGIMIRATGDDPAAADAMGVNVYLVRYICVAFGGALAGLAGAYLSLVLTPAWIERMTAGRGWIAFALVIFALWDPLKAILGAYLFGATEALQFFIQASLGVDATLLGMMPYVATILAMLVAASEVLRKRLGAPAALGKPYIRE
ncbi:MAG TPA: ABC transporter permease, partial [Candidatus Bathyarchaeota archaeon]|nr:ABC transporter permease [Candidatus Bathyarchaeota archaeon]